MYDNTIFNNLMKLSNACSGNVAAYQEDQERELKDKCPKCGYSNFLCDCIEPKEKI